MPIHLDSLHRRRLTIECLGAASPTSPPYNLTVALDLLHEPLPLPAEQVSVSSAMLVVTLEKDAGGGGDAGGNGGGERGSRGGGGVGGENRGASTRGEEADEEADEEVLLGLEDERDRGDSQVGSGAWVRLLLQQSADKHLRR